MTAAACGPTRPRVRIARHARRPCTARWRTAHGLDCGRAQDNDARACASPDASRPHQRHTGWTAAALGQHTPARAHRPIRLQLANTFGCTPWAQDGDARPRRCRMTDEWSGSVTRTFKGQRHTDAGMAHRTSDT
eukprot:6090083-Pleurochrysis_carterae.AAC.1